MLYLYANMLHKYNIVFLIIYVCLFLIINYNTYELQHLWKNSSFRHKKREPLMILCVLK